MPVKVEGYLLNAVILIMLLHKGVPFGKSGQAISLGFNYNVPLTPCPKGWPVFIIKNEKKERYNSLKYISNNKYYIDPDQ